MTEAYHQAFLIPSENIYIDENGPDIYLGCKDAVKKREKKRKTKVVPQASENVIAFCGPTHRGAWPTGMMRWGHILSMLECGVNTDAIFV